jgi:hypothetical protein
MAATQISNAAEIQNLAYSEDIDAGINATIVFKWASDASTVDARINEIRAASPPLGAIGTPGTPFEGSRVLSKKISAASGGTPHVFNVALTFGPPRRLPGSAWIYTFSTTSGSAQTNKDVDGDPIFVGTLDNTDDKSGSATITAIPKTKVMVNKIIPSTTVTAAGSRASNPFGSASGIVGKLNSGMVSITASGSSVSFAAGTLMLRGTNISSPNNGSSWNVNYTFEYRSNPDDWKIVVVGIDPETGKPYRNLPDAPVTKASAGTPLFGYVEYDMYEKVDFSPLGLT